MHVNAANLRMDAHHVPSSSSLAVQTLREADARTSHSFYVLSLVTSLQIVDKFVRAARKYYPKAYIHFEDFGLNNARRILEKYTPEIACFNDDVQGTGCVTLAAIMAAFKVSGIKWDEARFVMFGSGSAGTGIADQIQDAIAQNTGKPREEAGGQIWYATFDGQQSEYG